MESPRLFVTLLVRNLLTTKPVLRQLVPLLRKIVECQKPAYNKASIETFWENTPNSRTDRQKPDYNKAVRPVLRRSRNLQYVIGASIKPIGSRLSW